MGGGVGGDGVLSFSCWPSLFFSFSSPLLLFSSLALLYIAVAIFCSQVFSSFFPSLLLFLSLSFLESSHLLILLGPRLLQHPFPLPTSHFCRAPHIVRLFFLFRVGPLSDGLIGLSLIMPSLLRCGRLLLRYLHGLRLCRRVLERIAGKPSQENGSMVGSFKPAPPERLSIRSSI